MGKTKSEETTETGLVGRTIVAVRVMTPAELAKEGWDSWTQPVVCLDLDDGTRLFPSQDNEGNGPGALFGVDPSREAFRVIPRRGD